MKKCSFFTLWVFCAAIVCLVNVGSPPAQAAATAGSVSRPDILGTLELNWRDTGLRLTDNIYRWCFDGVHSGVLLADTSVGTVAYDWLAGTRTVLNSQPFSVCAPNGQLYADGPSRLFSLDDLAGQLIERTPTHFAHDGTSQVYWFSTPDYPNTTGTLLASSNGGITWSSIGDQFKGQIAAFAMASAYGQAIYALVKESEEAGEPYTDAMSGQALVAYTTIYGVYHSGNAGRTWDRKGAVSTFSEEFQRSFLVDFAAMPGKDASTDLIMTTIYVRSNYSNGGARNITLLSGDGGNSINWTNDYNPLEPSPYSVYSTQQGLLRFDEIRDVVGRISYGLNVSIDGGQHWLQLSLPRGLSNYSIGVNEQYPFVVYLNGNIISFDGGHTWQISDSGNLQFLPYWSLQAYRIQDGRLLLADVPGSESILTAQVAPNYAPGGTYFLETGHNLWGAFRQYWDSHDGRCTLGYPVTEPVPVESSSDSNVYITQRFERGTLKLQPGNGTLPDRIVLSDVDQSYAESNCGENES
jgi:hypothetical protein